MSSTSSQSSSVFSLHSQSKRVNLIVVGPGASEFRSTAALDTLLRQYPQFEPGTRLPYNHRTTCINTAEVTLGSTGIQNQCQTLSDLPKWAASLEYCAIPINTLGADVLQALQLGLDIIYSIPSTMVCLTDYDNDTNTMNMRPLEEIVPYQPFVVITNQTIPGLPDIYTIKGNNEEEKNKQLNLISTSNTPLRLHTYPAPCNTYTYRLLSSARSSPLESSSSYYQIFDGARIDPLYILHCSILGRRLEAIHRIAENNSTPFFEFIGHDGHPTNATRVPAHLNDILNVSERDVPLMPFFSIASIVREYMYRFFHYHFCKYSFDSKFLFSDTEIDYFRSVIDLAAQNPFFDEYTSTYNSDPQRDPIPGEAYISIHIDKDTVNPYRCAFGSVYSAPDYMLSKAKDVLRIRQVPFYDDRHYSLSGIAYDIPKEIFKVYYTIRLRYAPKNLFDAVAHKLADGNLKDFGIVSWSYNLHKGGEPTEEKLYVYESGPQEIVTMISSNRGIIHQYNCLFSTDELKRQDCADGAPRIWHQKLNSTGQKILDELSALHILQDSVEYVNKDKFSLYVPMWC